MPAARGEFWPLCYLRVEHPTENDDVLSCCACHGHFTINGHYTLGSRLNDWELVKCCIFVHVQDAVPRVGKFLVLFSRPGQRVIVDYRGDILVRPTAHEIHIRNGKAI